ncbi:MAG: hypothetical protein KC561_19350, partial [Myxococcales bacterium]|nr:hypothetical protein [Myxococcales bacterium]
MIGVKYAVLIGVTAAFGLGCDGRVVNPDFDLGVTADSQEDIFSGDGTLIVDVSDDASADGADGFVTADVEDGDGTLSDTNLADAMTGDATSFDAGESGLDGQSADGSDAFEPEEPVFLSIGEVS